MYIYHVGDVLHKSQAAFAVALMGPTSRPWLVNLNRMEMDMMWK
jgi:hypothetical protein